MTEFVGIIFILIQQSLVFFKLVSKRSITMSESRFNK